LSALLRFLALRGPFTALSASLLFCGCSRKAEPKRDVSPSVAASARGAATDPDPSHAVRHVVLLTIDALRADQPWSGYDGLKTPHLSRLAAESVVYTRAYSLANTTAASLGGLLGGRYPTEIGRDACILARYDMNGSLAPLLQKGGVHTFAAHGHALFAGDTAPQLGFDDWRLISGAAGRLQSEGAITSDDIAGLVIDHIGKADAERRQFIWAHFVDPHDAYVAHPEFPPAGTSPRALYDSEVAHTDQAIGSVLASLARSRLAPHAAVIVTADHGEAFGEHATARHGYTVYDEEVRIPLIVHVPGVSPRRIELPRSAIDLAPTIAELLGQPPSPRWRGTSLVHDWRPTEAKPRAVVVDAPEMVARTAAQAVIVDRLKVVVDNSGARAFDLAADPAEKSALPPEQSAAPIAEARRQLARLELVRAEPCGATRLPTKAQSDL
jgi:arylsulfatase A-like enzyme